FDQEGGGMAHDADGSVYVAGNIFEDDAGAKIYTDAAVARFDAHGRLDTSYGDAGFAIPLREADTYAQSLALRNGEAYLAGVQSRDSKYTFVTKVGRDGRIALTFGTAGVIGTYDFQESNYDPLLAVDGKGRIYVCLTDALFHRKLYRFNPDGSADTTFGL